MMVTYKRRRCFVFDEIEFCSNYAEMYGQPINAQAHYKVYAILIGKEARLYSPRYHKLMNLIEEDKGAYRFESSFESYDISEFEYHRLLSYIKKHNIFIQHWVRTK